MNTRLFYTAAIAALIAPAAHAQVVPPIFAPNAATASSSSETGSGAEAGVFGLGTAGVSTISGNESAAGSTSLNGVYAANPNLQVNSVDTYSATLGGTATIGGSSGSGLAEGGGGQQGSAQAYGQSYDPPLIMSFSPNAVMAEANSDASSEGGADYAGLSLGGTATMAGNEATGSALALNGVSSAEPNLQVNSVVTGSSSDGVSSVLSGMTGLLGSTGGEADQEGNGNGWGFSWVIPAP
ncbi:MAG: hypothetical protein ACKOXK_07635 [Chakrabartia sp.]